ncbi:MAG: PAS domain S-box protein [Methanoregulaceae archaeon]|nr:PAS domain S-box protein [Methanoregulaceae archaeon]
MRTISRLNLAVILISLAISIGIVLISIFSLKSGIYDIFPYFYIIPIIILAYRNPRIGVYFTIGLGWIYLMLVYLYGPFDIRSFAASVAWFYVFVTIGVVISAFSNEIARERRFREIFFNSQAGTFTFNPETQKINIANSQVSSLLGYGPEEMQDLDLSAILPDDEDRTGFLQEVSTEKKVSDAEIPFQKRDGERIWMLVSASLASDNQVICSTLDITERKRIKDALAYTEIHYRALFDSAGDAIVIHDLDGKIYEANAVATQKTGYTRSQLETMNLSDIDPFITSSSLSSLVAEVRRKGSVLRESVLCTSDNRTVPIEVSSRVIEYYRSPAIISIIRDISERKKAEGALQESERRYRQIGELIPFGVWITDGEGRLTYASQSFLDLLGLSLDECRNENWMERLSIDQRQAAMNDWQQCVLGGCFWDYEYRIRNRTGQEIYVLSRGAPMMDETGRIVSWVGLNLDISDRRQSENRLKASLKEKEVIIKEVHHRVKNNMQVISGFLQLQSLYIHDQDSLEKLEECQMRVKTMALVHEKLYQSGNLGYINTREYIESLVTDLMNSYALQTDISVSQDIDDVDINLDIAVPCGLILNELLTNALKYAFRGRDSGTISIAMHLGMDHRFSLVVSDDGVGLPEGLDIENAETLGLQLVTVLVRQIGGEMNVEGDGGTTFLIDFPERF